MRFFLVSLVVLFVGIGCSQKNKTTPLQENEIALTQPRVSSTSSIIDSSVVVSAELRMDDVNIFYTNDGTEPSMESTKYSRSFEVENEGIYAFKAFHSLWRPSEITVLKLYEKGIVPDDIKWISGSSDSYKGIGSSTLINQEKASLNFRNAQWVGFDSVAVAEVHFKKKTFIETISIGYLIDTQSWIFPPSSVKVYWNETDTLEIKVPSLQQLEPRELKDLQIQVGKELSSIRIEVMNVTEIPDWHDGKGNKAWLFMDEWIFK